MVGRLRMRLGRLVLRAGVRLMGFRPRQTLLFSDPRWSLEEMMAWFRSAAAARDVPPANPEVVFVPVEAMHLFGEPVGGL